MGVSALHTELARRSLTWLEVRATGRGIRGCEEVILEEGYVADAAAISGLTLQNEKLFLGVHRDWNDKESDDLVWVFESKVSRSDFLNTFKHDKHSGSRLTPIGNFHFVVCPKGLLKADEVPGFWGLLEQRGAGLGIVKMPELVKIDAQQLHKMAYRILRSKHETKFKIFDDLIKQFRHDQYKLELEAGGEILNSKTPDALTTK